MHDLATQATLAFDLGGTKLLAALVHDGAILERREIPTERDIGPDGWLERMSAIAADWSEKFARVGVAVTGQIHGGIWSPLNRETLDLPSDFALADKLAACMDQPAFIINDAQAAAWGEYHHGSSEHQDMVFLTVSTGIGGGIVLNGHLAQGRSGLSGHFGQTSMDRITVDAPMENEASGRWIADQAKRLGHPADTPAVFEAARLGADWANNILDQSAHKVGILSRNIQLILDPQFVVVGGGVGLADGYLDRVIAHCAELPDSQRPTFRRAVLGSDAGVLGVAELANKHLHFNQGGPNEIR
ncbi:MAG: ROK family protein [Stappiaceae bacterium]